MPVWLPHFPRFQGGYHCRTREKCHSITTRQWNQRYLNYLNSWTMDATGVSINTDWHFHTDMEQNRFIKAVYESEPGKLNYILGEGKGDPLLMIHGLGSDLLNYVYLARLLPAKLVIPDLLEFGMSDKPDDFSYSILDQSRTLLGLMDELGINHFNVLGHSAGGAIALGIAYLSPERIGKVITGEPNLLQLHPSPSSISGRAVGISESEYVSGFETIFHDLLFPEGNSLSDMHYAGSLRMSSPRAMYRTSLALSSMREFDAWKEFTMRSSLVMVGEHSVVAGNRSVTMERVLSSGVLLEVNCTFRT